MSRRLEQEAQTRPVSRKRSLTGSHFLESTFHPQALTLTEHGAGSRTRTPAASHRKPFTFLRPSVTGLQSS